MTTSPLPRVSAPGVVDFLLPLWEQLPEGVVESLAFSWLDAAAREVLPAAFEKAGLASEAACLRSLQRIDSVASLVVVAEKISSLDLRAHGDEKIELLAAFFSTAASLSELAKKQTLYDCAFALVMASRMTYGDDREGERIYRQLLEAGASPL